MRFIDSMDRIIIPAYRDMDAYDLPIELSSFQAQDMSKIGFLQELIDGIERCMLVHRKPGSSITAETMKGSTDPYLQLLDQATSLFNAGKYKEAFEQYTALAMNYPKSYVGLWGMIRSQTENFQSIGITINDLTNDLTNSMKTVKEVTPSEIIDDLQAQFDNFLHNAYVLGLALGQIRRDNESIETRKRDIMVFSFAWQ